MTKVSPDESKFYGIIKDYIFNITCNHGRIMTFWDPYANEIMRPLPQTEPPSNSPSLVLNILYS